MPFTLRMHGAKSRVFEQYANSSSCWKHHRIAEPSG